MSWRLSTAFAALMLCACHPQVERAAGPASSATIPPLRPVSDPIGLWFWLADGKGKQDDARIVEVDGHPCGAVARIETTVIPESNGVLDTDRVTEIDTSGAELARWRVPPDVSVIAVSGDRIGVSYHADTTLWIDTRGRIYAMAARVDSARQSVKCPSASVALDSDSTQCERLHDLASDAPRLIVSQDICS